MMLLYRWLLYLYPPGVRAEFSDEMSTVFAQAAEEHRQQGWQAYLKFALSECGGLLLAAGAARLRPINLWPMVAGVVVTVIMQSAFYAGATGAIRAAMGRARGFALPASDPRSVVLTLGMFAVVSVMCLLAAIIFLTRQVSLRRR